MTIRALELRPIGPKFRGRCHWQVICDTCPEGGRLEGWLTVIEAQDVVEETLKDHGGRIVERIPNDDGSLQLRYKKGEE